MRMWTNSSTFLFRTSLLVGLLDLFSYAHAEPNPVRASFCTAWPASYADWRDAFLSGNGKMGIMVLGNPLDETVVFNDPGFNLANADAPSH